MQLGNYSYLCFLPRTPSRYYYFTLRFPYERLSVLSFWYKDICRIGYTLQTLCCCDSHVFDRLFWVRFNCYALKHVHDGADFLKKMGNIPDQYVRANERERHFFLTISPSTAASSLSQEYDNEDATAATFKMPLRWLTRSEFRFMFHVSWLMSTAYSGRHDQHL